MKTYGVSPSQSDLLYKHGSLIECLLNVGTASRICYNGGKAVTHIHGSTILTSLRRSHFLWWTFSPSACVFLCGELFMKMYGVYPSQSD